MAVDRDSRNVVQLGAIELTFLAMMGVGTFGSFILQLGELRGWVVVRWCEAVPGDPTQVEDRQQRV